MVVIWLLVIWLVVLVVTWWSFGTCGGHDHLVVVTVVGGHVDRGHGGHGSYGGHIGHGSDCDHGVLGGHGGRWSRTNIAN